MEQQELGDAIASVPAGPWAVGVSGGADSVALLALLRGRADLSLRVVHLDHETRGEASTGDAAFVAELAARWDVPCSVARWRDVEADVPASVGNPSARFRAGRRVLFRRVVHAHALQGVILAHHADDQAETVMLRLMQRSGAAGLTGMSPRSVLDGLVVLRPLLGVRREALRAWLRAQGQPWREDESNASGKYLRNRVRRVLAGRDGLTEALLHVADAARGVVDWAREHAADERGPTIDLATLRGQPWLLARETAKRWLVGRGVPAGELWPDVVERLLTMASDAASPARQHFPGGVLARRAGGRLSAGPNDAGPR